MLKCKCGHEQKQVGSVLSNSFVLIPDNPFSDTRDVGYSEKELVRDDKIIICQNCVKDFFHKYNQELTDWKKRNEIYKKTVEDLTTEIEVFNSQKKSEEHKFEHGEMDMKIESLKSRIRKLKSFREVQIRENTELDLREKALNEKEDEYWRALLNTEYLTSKIFDDHFSQKRKEEYIEREKKRLENKAHWNIFTINVTEDGHFLTIDKQRLGRLAGFDVKWDEINAAFGLCVLMLTVLAKQMNFEFPNFKLLPRASRSEILSLNTGESFPLYYDENNRNLSSFNKALVAFLACLKAYYEYFEEKLFSVHGQKNEHETLYWFKMDETTIGGFDIRLMAVVRANEKELNAWTSALRRVLTLLRYLQNRKIVDKMDK